MPSPKWSIAKEAPIAAAIAAAVHTAWDGPEDGRSNRFLEALRKMVGPDVLERIELSALRVFQLQMSPPDGFEIPPANAHFLICPGCQSMRRTKFTRPQNGRLKLQALRDPEWLARQFELGRSTVDVARQLECSTSLVVDWAAKHGIEPPRTMRRREFDERVAQMHRAGQGPGAIARALETTVSSVRKSLRRQGLANRKTGHVYFRPEWWRERLEAGKTKTECAREAGIRPNAATYFINQFGLQAYTRRNAERGRRRKYPQLYDRDALLALLEKHGGKYEDVAAEIGCAPTTVSARVRKLLGIGPKWKPVPHAKREWWEERLAMGMTTWEMAEEAGIAEKTAREKLRLLGLLDEAYRVNARRELERRRERVSA